MPRENRVSTSSADRDESVPLGDLSVLDERIGDMLLIDVLNSNHCQTENSNCFRMRDATFPDH